MVLPIPSQDFSPLPLLTWVGRGPSSGQAAEDGGQGPSRQKGEEKQKEQSFQGVFTGAGG